MEDIRINGFDLVRLANIAYVNSQSTCALIELESMKSENSTRILNNQALAYDEKAFVDLIDKYQLGHNSVVTNLNSGIRE